MTDVVTGSVEREHRSFSPSKSERFFNCLGSTNLIARTPSRATTGYASEGQMAHDVLEAGLRNGDTSVMKAIKHSRHAAHSLAKSYTDFHSSVQDALDYIWGVMEYLDLAYGDAVMYVERYVDVPSVSAPGEAGGFCDVAIFSKSARILYVIDYKHGVGVAKAAVGNTQVQQYGAGFLFEADAEIKPEDVDVVRLVIIQPRAFHPEGEIREWNTTPANLVDYLIDMDSTIELARDPKAPLNPGVSWCQFCEARSSCPALAQSAVASILNDANKQVIDLKASSLPDLKSLDINRLAHINLMRPMINLWLDGVETHLDELSRAGYDVPGHKRVESQAKREYYGEPAKIATELAALIGCDVKEVYKPPALLNITDMEAKLKDAFKSRVGRGRKKLAAEQAAQMFAYYTLKKSSGNTVLVSLEDKRPAVNKTQTLFADVKLIPPPNQKDIS